MEVYGRAHSIEGPYSIALVIFLGKSCEIRDSLCFGYVADPSILPLCNTFSSNKEFKPDQYILLWSRVEEFLTPTVRGKSRKQETSKTTKILPGGRCNRIERQIVQIQTAPARVRERRTLSRAGNPDVADSNIMRGIHDRSAASYRMIRTASGSKPDIL